jgi:hypothetical protein
MFPEVPMVEVREVLRPWSRPARDCATVARPSVATWRQRSEVVWNGWAASNSSQMSCWGTGRGIAYRPARRSRPDWEQLHENAAG